MSPRAGGDLFVWEAEAIEGFVYILTNKPNGVLYIGVASNLAIRLEQHISRGVEGFARAYNCDKLVWFEHFENIHDARTFEKRMKKWNRSWKLKHIEERNPSWHDLSSNLF